MSIWERLTGAVPEHDSAAHTATQSESGGFSALFGRLIHMFGPSDRYADNEKDGGAIVAPHNQVAFTIAIIALGAKMARPMAS